MKRWRLSRNQIAFPLQRAFPDHDEDARLDCGYRVDILIENQLIGEHAATAANEAFYLR